LVLIYHWNTVSMIDNVLLLQHHVTIVCTSGA